MQDAFRVCLKCPVPTKNAVSKEIWIRRILAFAPSPILTEAFYMNNKKKPKYSFRPSSYKLKAIISRFNCNP